MLGLSSPPFLAELLTNTQDLFYHDLLPNGNTLRLRIPRRHFKHVRRLCTRVERVRIGGGRHIVLYRDNDSVLVCPQDVYREAHVFHPDPPFVGMIKHKEHAVSRRERKAAREALLLLRRRGRKLILKQCRSDAEGGCWESGVALRHEE